MSNTSYSFKENSHVIVNQGGEKKVMKKILSVALSTAMAFSMFASVAFGADANLTPQQKFDALKQASIMDGMPDGSAALEKTLTRAELAKIIVKSIGLEEVNATSYNDKNYSIHWARTFIEAATQAGILEGTDATKKLFDPSGNVTVEQLAAVLVRALKLEVPTETNNNASEWAKGYVEATVKAGLIDSSANFKANATRSQAIVAAYAIYEAAQFKVTKAEAVDATHVKLTLSDGTEVEHVLETPLVANQATNLEYTTEDGKVLKYTVTWVVTTATKVDKVAATNLKEVVVTFDGTVDKETAEEADNYSLKSGKAIDTAVLSEDEKTVTLTLVNTLTNNKVDYLNVANVKAGDKVLSAKEVEFTIADNELPAVSEVKSLGTKSVKVVFSEPVRLPEQRNFELDGKAYFGKITQPTSRTVILTPYNTSALSVGDHKLAVNGIKDFANFVSLTSSHDITVVEDKDAPTITEATATLETVTITFSEEVDVDTVKASSVYWKSGNSKKEAASVKTLADNKFKFTFSRDNSLPTGALPIYVEGVKDYSGNQIAKDTSVVVNAEIDQTRPEVKKVEAVNSKTIHVTFSKELLEDSVKNVKNYTVTDKDDKVLSVDSASRIGTDKNVIEIKLYGELSTGDNTLTIKNIKDNTRLENTMLDYSGKVNLADTKAPEIDSVLVNKSDRSVIIGFGKKMDYASLADYSNYHVVINNDRVTLTPEMADISVLQDSNAVAIRFVETYKNQYVRLESGSSPSYKYFSKLFVLGVKDEAGNLLKEFITDGTGNQVDLTSNQTIGLKAYDNDFPTYKAALVDNKTIEVKLSAAVSSAPKDAFTVTNGTSELDISSVEVTGSSTVKIVLEDELSTTSSAGLNVDVELGALTTLIGKIDVPSQSTTVLDKVAPAAKANKGSYKNIIVTQPTASVDAQIEVQFTEGLKLDSDSSVTLLAKDFKVVRESDNTTLQAGVEFEILPVTTGDDFVVIQLKDKADRKAATNYTVSFVGHKYLTDTSVKANEAASFSDRETNVKVNYVAVTGINVKTGATTIAVPNAGQAEATTTFTAEVKDQAGTVVNTPVSFAISTSPAPVGVNLTPAGVLTVQPSAAAGTFVIEATAAGVPSKTITVTLTKEAPKATSIVIDSTVTVTEGDTTATFSADVYDQYGNSVGYPDNVLVWTIKDFAPVDTDNAGAAPTINPATGEVTLPGTIEAGDVFTVVAKNAAGTITGTLVVTVDSL
ncbi:hypothetical protein J41TS12_00890 [Paenibacillus antibioticophila]|uniref:SLH domain-containing protein n=1 Tax=Paenibacillus antibioticophila TaxID=1274374 RepID=A0A919XPK1_9BACL|nr:Ig-like domain-containing protein [Paenibacillus antibioticophila]GIO35228.1 hypothetical protein J41TS12_00890 [Paenibacillus antibioticophila]